MLTPVVSSRRDVASTAHPHFPPLLAFPPFPFQSLLLLLMEVWVTDFVPLHLERVAVSAVAARLDGV